MAWQLRRQGAPQGRGELVEEIVTLPQDGVIPAGSRVDCRRVLELQEVLDDRANPRSCRPKERGAQVLNLLDYVLQIQIAKSLSAQERRLFQAPGIEVGLVEIASRSLDPGRHARDSQRPARLRP